MGLNKINRVSDGETIRLELQEAEEAEILARAKRVILVNSVGTVVKSTLQEENRSGSDASGTDGTLGRILTLQNSSESAAPIAVWVEGTLIALADMTIVNNSSSSTITFDVNEIFDADTIRVNYYI